MEKNTNSISWLHGLDDYFEFSKSHESNQFVKFLLKLLYANDPTIKTTDGASMEEFVYTLRKFAQSDILDVFYKYYRAGYDSVALQDAFSRGQVQSKIWLVNELSKIKKDFSCIYVLAGWFGQIRHFMDSACIEYEKMRIIDIDPTACKVSDQIFNVDAIEKYKVKSVELDLTDMSWLFRTGGQYEIKNYNNNSLINEKSIPDLVINTSAEHFHEDWYHKFVNRPQTTDPLFVIQSNNLHGIPDHINSIHSISEMKKKFPMSRIEFEGELQLQGYKRYMLIGRP